MWITKQYPRTTTDAKVIRVTPSPSSRRRARRRGPRRGREKGDFLHNAPATLKISGIVELIRGVTMHQKSSPYDDARGSYPRYPGDTTLVASRRARCPNFSPGREKIRLPRYWSYDPETFRECQAHHPTSGTPRIIPVRRRTRKLSKDTPSMQAVQHRAVVEQFFTRP